MLIDTPTNQNDNANNDSTSNSEELNVNSLKAELDAIKKNIAEKDAALLKANKAAENFRKQLNDAKKAIEVEFETQEEQTPPPAPKNQPDPEIDEIKQFIKQFKERDAEAEIIKKTGLNSIDDVKKIFGDDWKALKSLPQDTLRSVVEAKILKDPKIVEIQTSPLPRGGTKTPPPTKESIASLFKSFKKK